VSSAIAVPAYEGIPVTHRAIASTLTIVTGHEQRSDQAAVNWEALAHLNGTLVILMGVETLAHVTRQLLAGGLYPATPAAVIQQGTVRQQRSVTETLVTIAQSAREEGITSPAITVIGPVVALGASLAWFETLMPAADSELR
jgi:uroporphyrin-III C-methyltransferase